MLSQYFNLFENLQIKIKLGIEIYFYLIYAFSQTFNITIFGNKQL